MHAATTTVHPGNHGTSPEQVVAAVSCYLSPGKIGESKEATHQPLIPPGCPLFACPYRTFYNFRRAIWCIFALQRYRYLTDLQRGVSGTVPGLHCICSSPHFSSSSAAH
jgi:hypothetical protein